MNYKNITLRGRIYNFKTEYSCQIISYLKPKPVFIMHQMSSTNLINDTYKFVDHLWSFDTIINTKESGTNISFGVTIYYLARLHLMDLQNFKVYKTLQNKFNQGQDTSTHKILRSQYVYMQAMLEIMLFITFYRNIYIESTVYYFCLSCTNFGSLIRIHL